MESPPHPREDHKPLHQGVHRGIEPLGINSRKLLPEGPGELLESLGGRPVEDAEGLCVLCRTLALTAELAIWGRYFSVMMCQT